MRFLRVVIVSVLILSLVLNVVLYTKYRTKRSIITVNGEGITKKDIDDYLEQQAGPNVKAQMVQRRMIFQEATKLGVLPTDAEVEDEFNTQKEISWQFAREISGNPWAAGEAKNRIRQQIAQLRIMTKEVPVSDEEIKDTYKQNAMRFDTPNKAKAHLAIVINAGQANEIKQLMQKDRPAH